MIDLQNVTKTYTKGTHTFLAVNNVSFSIPQGGAVGLVGESGSGKSTIAKLVMGLEERTSGTIQRNGVVAKRKHKLFRPGDIQIIFQDPQSSLNPKMTVRSIIMEPLYALPKAERLQKGTEERLHQLIQSVGLTREHLQRYPHEFSGGQRQRIAIARALITDPTILILDEPTSALDVSVQAQVLNLLKDLRRERNLTYLFISHNMNVIRYMCDTVAVMYKGNLVEFGRTENLFQHPRHPYTKILLSSLPSVRTTELGSFHFATSDGKDTTNGCIFYDKCPQREEQCRTTRPPIHEHTEEWHSVCHLSK